MIRVARGPEPESLKAERRRRLAQAILDQKAGKKIDFDGYGVAKSELAQALNYKCVFCEMPLRVKGSPVEHFRPKAYVQNEGEPRDESRYWWLAWTWENLLFACSRCNNAPHKGNRFPLEPGTRPLPEMSIDLDAERPLLLDPSRTNPREHIRFRWSKTYKDWIPVPVRGSVHGNRTIDILKLTLDDVRSAHIKDVVEPAVNDLRAMMDQGNELEVRAMWKRKMSSLFAPRQPFHAVTWDVLDARFGAEERERWGLELPELGTRPHATTPTLFVDPAGTAELLASLPEELQLRVRVLDDHVGRDQKHAVLDELLRLRQWTDEELARLLQLEARTIRTYVREREHSSGPVGEKSPAP